MDTPDRSIFILYFGISSVVLMLVAAIVSPDITPWEWFLLFASTLGLSRIISREKVGQPIRDWAEGTEFQELVNCPRCIGVWIVAALLWLVILAPDASIVPLVTFSVGGLNILVQEVLGILCRITTLCDTRINPTCTKEIQ